MHDAPSAPLPPSGADALALSVDPTLLADARALAPELVAVRRDLHRHPELGFAELRTAGIAAQAMETLGFSVRTGVARTGVVADLVIPGDGPTVALRADMDALPIHEENDHDFTSTVPGRMHACGHDAHVAGLLGAARLLAARAKAGALPPGRVRFLFQPSEEGMDAEGKSGGRRMVEEGAMAGVDAVVGLHVGAHVRAGTVLLDPGPFFAGADNIEIEIHGKSAHAARPHQGIDAILLAAHGITLAQQAVARGIAPDAAGVVSLGTIRGGTARNIICDRVEIQGTLRYFDPAVRHALRTRVAEAFQSLEGMGARVVVRFVDGYPPVRNDPAVTTRVRGVAAALLGAGALETLPPTMGAEDFSFLAQEAPGAYLWLGAALPDAREHHHPRFDIDESVLPLGAAILAGSAMNLLSTPLR
jgi:IAA-amino acid hydrolase